MRPYFCNFKNNVDSSSPDWEYIRLEGNIIAPHYSYFRGNWDGMNLHVAVYTSRVEKSNVCLCLLDGGILEIDERSDDGPLHCLEIIALGEAIRQDDDYPSSIQFSIDFDKSIIWKVEIDWKIKESPLVPLSN